MRESSKRHSTKLSKHNRASPTKSTDSRWHYLAFLVLSLGVLFCGWYFSSFIMQSALPQNASKLSALRPSNASTAEVNPIGDAGDQSTPPTFVLPVEARPFVVKSEQDKLLEKVEQVLVEFPKDATAAHVAAITYAELLQTDKAAQHFENSLALKPAAPEVLAGYAALLLQTSKQQAAVELLKEPAASSSASVEVLQALAKAYAETGELENAASILTRCAAQFPEVASVRLSLAQVQLQLQQFEDAEANARAAISLGSNSNPAYTALSSALIRLGKREEALKVRSMNVTPAQQTQTQDDQYQQSFQKFSSHTYGLLANVYRANRQPASAEACLLESLKIEPMSVTSLTGLADLLYQQQRMADAILVYQRLTAVQPENLFNYNNLASLAVSVGNIPLAEESLRRSVEYDPTGNATLRLADFLLRTGKHAEASEKAEAAVRKLENADAYLVWIAALKAEGKLAAAMNALLQARELIKDDLRIRNLQLY